jgi:hypothetical protein
MTGTIIVGVDGSNTAGKAAESARNLALALKRPTPRRLGALKAIGPKHTAAGATNGSSPPLATRKSGQKCRRQSSLRRSGRLQLKNCSG